MYWACTYKSGYAGYSDSEVQIVGWISEHVPSRSNISIDYSFLSRSSDKKRMLEHITGCHAYYINEIIEIALKDKNYSDVGLNKENFSILRTELINYLKSINIQYLIISEHTLTYNKIETISILEDLISNYFNKILYEY